MTPFEKFSTDWPIVSLPHGFHLSTILFMIRIAKYALYNHMLKEGINNWYKGIAILVTYESF